MSSAGEDGGGGGDDVSRLRLSRRLFYAIDSVEILVNYLRRYFDRLDFSTLELLRAFRNVPVRTVVEQFAVRLVENRHQQNETWNGKILSGREPCGVTTKILEHFIQYISLGRHPHSKQSIPVIKPDAIATARVQQSADICLTACCCDDH